MNISNINLNILQNYYQRLFMPPQKKKKNIEPWPAHRLSLLMIFAFATSFSYFKTSNTGVVFVMCLNNCFVYFYLLLYNN